MFNGKKKAITFSYDDGVTQDIRHVELFNKYSLKATFNYAFGPTVYHHRDMDTMFTPGERFPALEPDEPAIFYIRGRFEEFLAMISGKSDIFYGTNKEVPLP